MLAVAQTSSHRDPGMVVVWTGASAVMAPMRVPATGCTLGRELLATLDGLGADDRLSRQHARVAPVAGRHVVTDLSSRNGSFVDGRELRGTDASLAPPALVRTGRTLWALVPDVGVFEGGVMVRDGDVVRGPSTRAAYATARTAAVDGRNLVVVGAAGVGKRTLVEFYADQRDAQVVVVTGRDLATTHLPAGPTVVLLRDAELMSPIAQATLDAWLDVRPDLAVAIACVDLRAHRAVLPAPLLARLEGQVVSLPSLDERPDELAAMVELAVARIAPDLEVHVTLVEACLLRAWPRNLHGLFGTLDVLARTVVAQRHHVVRGEDLARVRP